MKLNTASTTLDRLNSELDRTKARTPHVKVAKDVLFALITDHRDLCRALMDRGTYPED